MSKNEKWEYSNTDKRRGLNGQEVKRWLLESIPEEWER